MNALTATIVCPCRTCKGRGATIPAALATSLNGLGKQSRTAIHNTVTLAHSPLGHTAGGAQMTPIPAS